MKAGSTPLPAIWALETSRDFGISYEPIHYYAADQEDCSAYFGVIPIDSDEDEDPVCLLKSNSSWEESESVSNLAPFFCCLYFEFFSNRFSPDLRKGTTGKLKVREIFPLRCVRHQPFGDRKFPAKRVCRACQLQLQQPMQMFQKIGTIVAF